MMVSLSPEQSWQCLSVLRYRIPDLCLRWSLPGAPPEGGSGSVFISVVHVAWGGSWAGSCANGLILQSQTGSETHEPHLALGLGY